MNNQLQWWFTLSSLEHRALGSILSTTGLGRGAIRSYRFIIFVLFLILLSIRVSVTAIIFLTLGISIGFFLFRVTASLRNVVFILLYCNFLQHKSKNKSSERFSQYILFWVSEAVKITELAQDWIFTTKVLASKERQKAEMEGIKSLKQNLWVKLPLFPKAITAYVEHLY